MGKRVVVEGTGFRRRSKVVFENPMTEAEFNELGEMVSAPAGFENRVGKPTEAAMWRALESAGLTRETLGAEAVRRHWPGPVGPDAMVSMALGLTGDRPDRREGYAARILSELFFLRRIRSKDPDAALMSAFRLGSLITEAKVEFDWIRKVLGEGRNEVNRERAEAGKEEQRGYQATADEIWKKHPNWGNKKVGEEVGKRLGDKTKGDYIRRLIKKPTSEKKAGPAGQ